MNCDIVASNLVLYIYIPLTVSSLLLGLFILFSKKDSAINRNLSIFIFLFSFWLIVSLLTWFVSDVWWNVFLARLSVLEIFTLLFFLYFSYAFSQVSLSWKKKIFLALPFLPVLLFLFTDHNAYLIESSTCETANGLLYYYVYFLGLSYTFLSIRVLFFDKENQNARVLSQVKVISTALTFTMIWFLSFIAAANFFKSENLYLFLPFGVLIFIISLVRAITKHQFLETKVLAAKLFTVVIWILILSQLLFVQSIVNIVLITATFLVSLGFGIMLISSVRDEVQRKEELQMMADRLAISNDRLRELDNTKTEFISIASHQLRTPLTAIKGYCSLLIDGSYGSITKEIEEVLHRIILSNDRLVNLVENLLSVSRMEAGRMEYKFEEHHIESILQELQEPFDLSAQSKNLAFSVNLPDHPLLPLQLDKQKIQEVLSNLIDNAIKYTNEGSVSVTIEQDPNSHKTRIIVKDSGIGIPASEIPFLFSKFSRGKDVNRLHANGTGLGLYVAKNIVEAHHGTIHIESEGDGKGTAFIVELG